MFDMLGSIIGRGSSRVAPDTVTSEAGLSKKDREQMKVLNKTREKLDEELKDDMDQRKPTRVDVDTARANKRGRVSAKKAAAQEAARKAAQEAEEAQAGKKPVGGASNLKQVEEANYLKREAEKKAARLEKQNKQLNTDLIKINTDLIKKRRYVDYLKEDKYTAETERNKARIDKAQSERDRDEERSYKEECLRREMDLYDRLKEAEEKNKELAVSVEEERRKRLRSELVHKALLSGVRHGDGEAPPLWEDAFLT